jgi:hypothetical protein
MGKFLREQVRPDPQVFDKATRATMQTHQVTTAGSNVRGAWGSTKPGSAQADIWHNGDNLVSYAHIVVSLSQKIGYGAMSNVNSTFGAPAVNEMLEVTQAMHSNWNALFSEPNAKFWECAHPMPAVVMAGQKMIVFGRQHNGKVLRRRSLDAGDSWQADGNFENGVFTSGMAAGISSNGQLIYVFGRGTDNRIWFAFSTNGGTNWKGWTPIGTRTFQTGSAVTVDASGNIINVFAIGMDRKMYRTHLTNASQDQNWNEWEPIRQGIFTSAPAAAASSDGKIIHVFGRGTDHRIWRNESQNSGASSSWLEHWVPMGKGTFTSGIAAAASSNGLSVQVIGRGTDRKLWRYSLSNSDTGLKKWKLISGDRTFTSAPSIAMSSNGSGIDVFAFSGDFRIYRNHSTNGGENWVNWEQVGPEFFL